MTTRWPERVKDAVKEAHAAGLTPSETLRKLHAGTLPGLEGRVTLVPERTMFDWWDQAKRARRKALAEAPTCPTCGQQAPGLGEPKPTGGGLLESIARDIEARKAAEGDHPNGDSADADPETTIREG